VTHADAIAAVNLAAGHQVRQGLHEQALDSALQVRPDQLGHFVAVLSPHDVVDCFFLSNDEMAEFAFQLPRRPSVLGE
jgi:hypothetical protein